MKKTTDPIQKLAEKLIKALKKAKVKNLKIFKMMKLVISNEQVEVEIKSF